MGPLFDQNCGLVGWIDPGNYIFDKEMNAGEGAVRPMRPMRAMRAMHPIKPMRLWEAGLKSAELSGFPNSIE